MSSGDLRVALEERADDLRAGLIQARGDELAAAAAPERGADAIDDDSVLKFHEIPSGPAEP